MPELRVLERTWITSDKAFRKALKRLPPKEREERLDEIADLMNAIAVCRHPAADPGLERWRPTAYSPRGMRKPPKGHLVEYRGRRLLRIIAWYEKVPAEVVVMIVGTLDHDHERLSRAISAIRRDIPDSESWGST